ncbi:MAG: YqzL family protein [Oscillospiraceae bacterium]|nr:YqzL family protein [Oscillospiraceae bacterium]
MTELNRLSWETFTRTGNIDAYLLYKSINNTEIQEDKDNTWRKSEREALS